MDPSSPCCYGPVPSRRFGLSLGVDLVPPKTCCHDCVYCQLGPTTERTVERRDARPPAAVLEDVRQALERGPMPETITLAGSGEPTLYHSLGPLIRSLRHLSRRPVALLTNGALLHRDDVAEDAAEADVVAPSLDAPDAETYRRLNRPHPSLSYERVVGGIRAFGERFEGSLRLEVMLVAGVNDSDAALVRLGDRLEAIPHDAIDVNTVVRPARDGAQPVPDPVLHRAEDLLGPRARAIAPRRPEAPRRRPDADAEEEERVLGLLRRRPATIEDLGAATGLPAPEVRALLEGLQSQGRVETCHAVCGDFYVASSPS